MSNYMEKASDNDFSHLMPAFLSMLNVFCPHITEEIWQNKGNENFLSTMDLPNYDEALTKDDEKEIAVQVLGKVRGKITITDDMAEQEVKELVLENQQIQKYIGDKEIKKFIYVKGRIVNIIV